MAESSTKAAPSTKVARRTPGRLSKSEWISAAAVIALVVLFGVWLFSTGTFQNMSSQMGLTRDRPVDIFGRIYCRPACRSSFKRCEVSTGGFAYQQSRCQETLKQCLIVCDQGGRKQ